MSQVLVAHSAWWHRQTPNLSPEPRVALLACFVRSPLSGRVFVQGDTTPAPLDLGGFVGSRRLCSCEQSAKAVNSALFRGGAAVNRASTLKL